MAKVNRKQKIKGSMYAKYKNGGIPIPSDTGTDSTVYNSEEEADKAGSKWARTPGPKKYCNMRFGYRVQKSPGVVSDIKYVTYTNDDCAKSIIEGAEKKTEQEKTRQEWEESPEGKETLDKSQSQFVRMINEAYEESKRNQ
jgi:hypothetical protein